MLAGTSSSGKMAVTGHSGSQAPQSMHSSGWMYSWSSPSYMQSTGQTSTHALSLTPMHASVITYVMKPGLLRTGVSTRIGIEIRIAPGRRKGIAALALALLAGPIQAQSIPACEGGKTALVLSG